MISYAIEEKVREAIRAGQTDRAIAQECGVSPDTVQRIKRMLRRVEALDPKVVAEIKYLLTCKLPIPAIEVRMAVSQRDIKAISRFAYLYRNDRGTPRGQPDPGASIDQDQARCRDIPAVPSRVGRDEALAMYRMIREIVEMTNLRVVEGPLFHSLAHRARKLLREMNPKRPSCHES